MSESVRPIDAKWKIGIVTGMSGTGSGCARGVIA
jgi:hypothetical protein